MERAICFWVLMIAAGRDDEGGRALLLPFPLSLCVCIRQSLFMLLCSRVASVAVHIAHTIVSGSGSESVGTAAVAAVRTGDRGGKGGAAMGLPMVLDFCGTSRVM